jgi:uncharacterized protein
MKLSEMQFGAALPVEGYGPGFFRVGGAVHEGAVLVTPAGVRLWAGLEDVASLLALKGEVDVIFLGMGAQVLYPPKALREALEAAEIGLEVMSSSAAARTYNVCLSEGRRVAAALLVV